MSVEISAKGVLLDVEGTTSAVAYVYEVMFPFARRRLESYIRGHWSEPAFHEVRERFSRDAEGGPFDSPEALCDEAVRLMDGDVKATGLKALQGLIWESGFRSGELRAHVYPDVAPAISAWRAAGLELRVYSSGSVHAQRLFFGHSEAGDLLPNFTGHYDTTIGPKRESPSYHAISVDWGLEPSAILFLSDITEELNAAREAGFQTALVRREGNAEPRVVDPPHPSIASFDQITFG